jgi:hypothetical protein
LLHVNQAGKHIEALLVRLPSPGTGTGITQQRLAGDLKDDGAFLVYSVTDSSEASGKLRLHGQDLIVDLPICDCPPNTTFHLREQRSTFLDAALESLIEVQETLLGPDPTSTMFAERSEILPLSDAQMLRLEEAFSDNAIRPFLEKRYQVGSGSTSVDAFDRVNTTDKLDKYVGQVLAYGWPRQQLPMVREYAKTIGEQPLLRRRREARKSILGGGETQVVVLVSARRGPLGTTMIQRQRLPLTSVRRRRYGVPPNTAQT